jgi:fumarate hydratase subunit beta
MSESPIHLKTPLKTEDLTPLHIGDRVLLSGTIYTGRDAAHHRLAELINAGGSLPLDLEGQVIYYVGPTPPKPGQALGAAGPTSSYRMDAYTPALLEKGLKGMIGKGARDQSVKEGIQKYKAVYFAAIGGAGALISRSILAAEVIAYPDLGTEAIRKLDIKAFPLIVANDVHGGDLYESGMEEYKR